MKKFNLHAAVVGSMVGFSLLSAVIVNAAELEGPGVERAAACQKAGQILALDVPTTRGFSINDCISNLVQVGGEENYYHVKIEGIYKATELRGKMFYAEYQVSVYRGSNLGGSVTELKKPAEVKVSQFPAHSLEQDL